MIALFSIGYVFLFIELLLLGISRKLKFTNITFRVILIGAVIAACCLTQHIELKGTDPDLYRQFLFIDEYRIGGLDILKRNLGWTVLWGREVYFYLFSLFENKYLICTINAILVYMIFQWTTADYIKRNNCGSREISMSILMFMLFCTFVNITNGIRFALASAIVMLSIYLHAERKGKILKSVALFVIALSIHQGTTIYIAVYAVCCLVKKTKNIYFLYVIAFCGVIAANPIGDFLISSSNLYLQKVGQSIVGYAHAQMLDSRSIMISCLIISVIFSVVGLNTPKGNQTRSFRYCIMLANIALICSPFQIVSERILIGLSIFSLPIFKQMVNNSKCKSKEISKMCLVICLGAFCLLAYYRLQVFSAVYDILF